jgi:hypothetical protein
MNQTIKTLIGRSAKPFLGKLAPALRSAIVPENSEPLIASLRRRLANDAEALAELETLIASHNQTLYEGQIWPHVQKYNQAIVQVFGQACAAPTHFFHTSWSFGHPIGDLHNLKLAELFVAFEQGLIRDLKENGPDGDIVEFGIYQGFMLGKLLEQAEAIGLKRTFYGFDSFEGLSEPSRDADYDSWQKGQYAAGYDLVAKNLRLSERPHLKLVKGWVEDSLKTLEAQAIRQIAYARIDVDIYDPTVDCLNYLTGRMADRSILVFDDWAYTTEKGESRAFFEWVARTPQYKFEWLGQCSSRFYLRVLHR